MSNERVLGIYRANGLYWLASDGKCDPSHLQEGCELELSLQPDDGSIQFGRFKVIEARDPDPLVSSREAYLPHGIRVIEVYLWREYGLDECAEADILKPAEIRDPVPSSPRRWTDAYDLGHGTPGP